MSFWTIPREWEGETCAVLASGPSMTREVAELVRGRCRVIAVGNQGIDTKCTDGRVVPAFAPWADVLYAADRLWWSKNSRSALAFPGRKVTIAPNQIVHTAPISPEVVMVGNGGPRGFDDRQTHMRTGSNSGYQSVHLAAHFGAKRILLCGFDMHGRKGEHWFGDHFWRPRYKSRYALFIHAFEHGAPEFRRRGIEIINCTPGSALKCFPFQDLDEALRETANPMQRVREGASLPAQACAPEARAVGAAHAETAPA